MFTSRTLLLASAAEAPDGRSADLVTVSGPQGSSEPRSGVSRAEDDVKAEIDEAGVTVGAPFG